MTLAKYTTGFILSLVLTVLAYLVVTQHAAASGQLLLLLGCLAIVQAIVQLVFFLHLGEVGSRQKVISFAVMMGVLVILIVGSLWIMQNLNYNMIHLTPGEKTNVMFNQYDKGGF